MEREEFDSLKQAIHLANGRWLWKRWLLLSIGALLIALSIGSILLTRDTARMATWAKDHGIDHRNVDMITRVSEAECRLFYVLFLSGVASAVTGFIIASRTIRAWRIRDPRDVFVLMLIERLKINRDSPPQ